MFGNALACQIETIRELHDRMLLSVRQARDKLEADHVAKSGKHGGRCRRFANLRHRWQRSWPAGPNLPGLNAALPIVLPRETVESPSPQW